MSITQRGQLKRDDSNNSVGWGYENIVLAAPTTTVVKASAGILHSIVINKPTASGVITIYDNTAASGTKIATITMPATLLSDGPHLTLYDLSFDTGLTVVTSGAAQDITVTYI
jgi:hypothetical protein